MVGIFDSISGALGLEPIFFWLNKLTAVFLIWWFGGKLSSKFESKLPSPVRLIVRIISGIAIYWAGVLIGAKYFLTLPFGLGDFAGTLVAFVGFFILGELLFSGLKSKSITREEFDKLNSMLLRLEAVVSRLVTATTTKKVMDQTISDSEAEKVCEKFMKDKGFEEFKISEVKREDDKWLARVQCRIRAFELSIDPVSSQVLKFAHAKGTPKDVILSFGNYFYNHKPAIIGVLLLLLFVSFISSLSTAESDARISELISLQYEGNQSSGLVSDLLSGGSGNLDNNLVSGLGDVGSAFNELPDEQKQQLLDALIQSSAGSSN